MAGVEIGRIVDDLHSLYWEVYRRRQELLSRVDDIKEELELIEEYGVGDVAPKDIERMRTEMRKLEEQARRYGELLKELDWLTSLPAIAYAAAPEAFARRLESLRQRLRELEG